jgi:hypothetical protein
LSSLDGELLDDVTFLSRQARRVLAMPVDRDDLVELGAGADEYELLVDAECGFLLRAEARLTGQPLHIIEMTVAEVNPDIPASTCLPPNGSRFVVLEPPRMVEIPELAASVPFLVFVLDPPPGDLMGATIENDRLRRGNPSNVMLTYLLDRRGGLHGFLWIQEAALPGRDRTGEDVGPRMQEIVGATSGQRTARVERGGTEILLPSTELTEEELLGIAETLMPAPGPDSS